MRYNANRSPGHGLSRRDLVSRAASLGLATVALSGAATVA